MARYQQSVPAALAPAPLDAVHLDPRMLGAVAPARNSPQNARTCACGTKILFPPGVMSRTCWNCGASLPRPVNAAAPVPLRSPNGMAPSLLPAAASAAPVARAPPAAPMAAAPAAAAAHGLPSARAEMDPTQRRGEAPDAGGSSPSADLRARRPSWLPAPPAAKSQPAERKGSKQQPPPSRTWCDRASLLVCLSVSLLGNAVLLGYGSQEAWALLTRTPVAGSKDVRPDLDGDGVPDADDFCSEPCRDDLRNGSNCAARSWRSGRATDFDGDGCQDGIEDLDRDNDGVRDVDDDCPLTPQNLAFVSNSLSDFDGDGCADGVEDTDNDGDKVSNNEDYCPRTAKDAQHIDASGCSKVQLSSESRESDPRWWELLRLGQKASRGADVLSADIDVNENAEPWYKVLVATLRGAWVEVLLGAVLTALMAGLHSAFMEIKERVW
eukprot:TRINITY_DN3296_c0_g2_i2.p1 TRINITY_DN3296_c0_g2~~TRINITY_DN3296_c0_g2_i2.p1  ORF type:complete len:439 (-),score=75.32 TRINITY_DN3296_c0_g2_i2:9-1325(-)